jgi:hypothetical protein
LRGEGLYFDSTVTLTLTHEIILNQIRTDLGQHFNVHAQDVFQAAQQLIEDLDAKRNGND